MKCSRTVLYFKQITPIFLGLCLGIALSIIVTPFMEEDCIGLGLGLGGNARSVILSLNSTDKYEPRQLNAEERAKRDNVEDRKPPVRPRFVRDELGIRDKLFVAILTSQETVETMAVAINRTLTHHLPKVVFFMESQNQPKVGKTLTMVAFSDDRPLLKPFHMFRYIGDHYLNSYDWFFIVQDTTYVRGEKLMDFVNHLSISQDLYLGKTMADVNAVYCMLGGGFILGQAVMTKIVNELDWCTKNAFSSEADDNIGRCLLHSANLACSESVNGKQFKTYQLKQNFNFEADIKVEKKKEDFNSAITLHSVTDPDEIYRLHRYFSELDLTHTHKMIAELQKQIMNVSRLAPGGQAGFPWPVGVREPSSPKTRFDVIRYDYFTETHVYLGTDHSNIAELRGADKEDVDDIIRVAKEKLLQKYGKKYVFGRLVNGYRRFDATRGMEYLLDVALRERDGDYELHRRVRLVRPLSHVEIVPMPYVTENTRVAVVLAARRSDRPRLAAFLRHYERTALAAGDNSVLMAVFVYEHAGDATAGDDDAFAEVKALVAAMERKYKDGAKIAWMNVRAREPSEFHLLDVVSKKFQPEALLLRTTADIELNPELLNRCRMNAILRWQVFFPMGFYEYKPSVVYGTDVAPPETLDINRVHGHFDRDAYEHACFYNGDYAETRKIIADAIPIVTDVKKVPDGVARAAAATPTPDLYELFLRSRLHVFRAVEPALRSRYRAVVCDAHAQEEAAYRRCLARRGEALGSRSQLAKLILDAQADEKGQEDQV